MNDDKAIESMARAALPFRRGVYFSREQLEAMPDFTRATIESEARRLYGVRRSPPPPDRTTRGEALSNKRGRPTIVASAWIESIARPQGDG